MWYLELPVTMVTPQDPVGRGCFLQAKWGGRLHPVLPSQFRPGDLVPSQGTQPRTKLGSHAPRTPGPGREGGGEDHPFSGHAIGFQRETRFFEVN